MKVTACGSMVAVAEAMLDHLECMAAGWKSAGFGEDGWKLSSASTL